ncbi:MAG TPA: MaoC/PaaZ C-terminal domain-containing protein [Casimicrobiaceae bacterium]
MADAAATASQAASAFRLADVEPGDTIPPLVAEPVTRLQLALFASAAADSNPIHVDDAAARAGGLPGAIVHGMLTMAFLGRLLTRSVPLASIRALEGRFVAMAFPGDAITCTGTIVGKSVEAGEQRVEIELAAQNQRGTKLLAGKASVALA